jgi:hypothetical protein
MEKFTETVSLVIQPVSFVTRAIRPLLSAKTFAKLISPFSLIDCTTWKANRTLRNLSTWEGCPWAVKIHTFIMSRVLIVKILVVVFLPNQTSTICWVSKWCIVYILVLLICSESLLHVFFVYLFDDWILWILTNACSEHTSAVTHFLFMN